MNPDIRCSGNPWSQLEDMCQGRFYPQGALKTGHNGLLRFILVDESIGLLIEIGPQTYLKSLSNFPEVLYKCLKLRS